MKVFVHSATECFTDHLAHGEGLIFYDYLRSLVGLGYQFEGYSARVEVQNELPGTQIHPFASRFPLKSFQRVHYGAEINRRFRRSRRSGATYGFVWRGNPFHQLCPVVPSTGGLPLVIGPLFRDWPRRNGKESEDAASRRVPLRPGHLAARLGERGWERTLQRADLILSTSPRLTRELTAVLPHTTRVLTIPVIIDQPRGVSIEKADPDSGWRFSWVGRLCEQKFPFFAIDTLLEVRRRGVKATLTMAGEGPMREQIERVVEEKGLHDCVKVLGAIPNQQVWELHRQSHIHLSTSVDEPYGRAIVEAMCMGGVPVTHRSGGPAEFIRNGENGVLVPEHDPKAFAESIAFTLQDRSVYQRLSHAAADSTKEFSSEAVSSRLHQAFQELQNAP